MHADEVTISPSRSGTLTALVSDGDQFELTCHINRQQYYTTQRNYYGLKLKIYS